MKSTHALIPSLVLILGTFNVYATGFDPSNPMLMPGSSRDIVIKNNVDFKGSPACYIACYSYQKQRSIYSIGHNLYVMGNIRVSGTYQGKVCKPTHFEDKDISKEVDFKQLCSKKIKACKSGQCWAGGDTGDGFGITSTNKKNHTHN